MLRSARSREFAWADFISIAHEHRVLPALLPQLGQQTLSELMPRDAADILAASTTHRRTQNRRIRDQALEVASNLNHIGVTPLFLKGGAHLLSGLYPDIAMRVMVDLDILVPAARLDDCVASLKADGVEPLTDYMHPRWHHHPPLCRRDLPVPIELHRHVLAHPHGAFLPPHEMDGASVLLADMSARIAVPSAACAIVHNVAHAQLSHHEYIYGLFDLRGLLDFALLVRAHGHALDWDEIRRRFRRSGNGAALDYHLLSASDLLGVQTPISARPRAVPRFLYRRAIAHVRRPGRLSLSVRLLRPWMLLRRELSEPDLRARLARNVTDRAWWARHLRTLVGR